DAPLTLQREHAVLDANVDVFLLDLRQVGLDQVLVVVLDDVRAGTPAHAFIESARAQASDLARITIEEVVELSERAPTDQVHVVYLLAILERPFCGVISGLGRLGSRRRTARPKRRSSRTWGHREARFQLRSMRSAAAQA